MATPRSSNVRHLFGTAGQPEDYVGTLRLFQVESNVLRANSSVFAIPWANARNLTVIPLNFTGVVPRYEQPLIVHDEKTVQDFNFNPFYDNILTAACSDGSVAVWDVPLDGMKQNLTAPLRTIQVSDNGLRNVSFHPLAENVMVTIDWANIVRIHDLETGEEKLVLPDVHQRHPSSITWNGDGSLCATSCDDKFLRIFDPRSNSVVVEVASYQGSRESHALWLSGKRDWIFTVGFSKSRERAYFVWDPRNLTSPLRTATIDNRPGNLMPFYDVDSSVLWLAGRGDENIRYYEIVEEPLCIHYLHEFRSKDPQYGVAQLPKNRVDVMKCEIMRFLKINAEGVVTRIRFEVPRSDKNFQEDLFPDTFDGRPSMKASEWFGGANVPGKLMTMNPAKK